jgi:hypothetical protein
LERYEAKIRAWLEAERTIPAATVLTSHEYKSIALDGEKPEEDAEDREDSASQPDGTDHPRRWIKRMPLSSPAAEREIVHSITTLGNIHRGGHRGSPEHHVKDRWQQVVCAPPADFSV